MFKGSRRNGLGPAVALAAAMMAVACEEDVTSVTPPFAVPADYAFVTTTDFSTGAAAIVAADTTLAKRCSVAPIHSDAVARYFEGRIYVVNRNGADNIQVLEPAAGFATLKQFSVGNGSDPHDIAFVSRSRAFVTRYNEDQIWIVDTNTGRRSGLIDLSWLADADFIPEMDHMLRISNRVFVSVQRLNRNTDWGPVGTSYIAVFDPYTEQFIDADPATAGVQALTLSGTNPFGEMVLNPKTPVIWVPAVGRFGLLDGGLEVVNPQTLESQLVLTESQLGGDITDVVPVDENRGVAIISDPNFNTLLVGFDLSVSGAIDTLYAPGSFSLQDAELSRDDRIFVSDRTAVLPGLRVFDAETWRQITTTPIDVCLPPSDIEFGRAN
jgi:hypothetical protein